MTDTTQYLYTIRPTRLEMLTEGPTAEEAEIVSQHFNYLQSLIEAGVLILAGRTQNADESSFGIVIFAADTEDAARDLMANDPAVKNGVMRAKLYPYRVALMTEKRPV